MAPEHCTTCQLVLGPDDKQIVACDSCRSRTHVAENCSGLSASEVRAVILQKRTLMHFCSECRNAFKSVPLMIRKIVKLEEEIESLKTKMQSLEQQKAINAELPITLNTENMFYEIDQRLIRSSNLMIYNLQESNSEVLQERIDHDKSLVSELFNKIGLMREYTSVKKVVRVGKTGTNGKTRPVKVICDNADVVKLALKSANKLRGTKVRISRDHTKIQQEAYKEAKKLLEGRKAAGEANLVIKYFNGTPKVVANQKNPVIPH